MIAETPSLFPVQALEALGADISTALRAVRGLERIDSHRARLACGGRLAAVWIDAPDRARLELEVEELEPMLALLRCAALPSSARYAATARGLRLVADAGLGGPATLAEELEALRAELGALELDPAAGAELAHAEPAAPAPSGAEPAAGPEPREVEAAIAALGWPAEACVRLPESWELRPRLEGNEHPVRVDLEPGGLWLHRRVCPWPASAGNSGHAQDAALAAGLLADVLADQALRLNARLRHARLACAQNALVAEARLSAALLTPRRLGDTAMAVAAAWRHARGPIEALRAHPDVARCYARVLLTPLTPDEDPMP